MMQKRTSGIMLTLIMALSPVSLRAEESLQLDQLLRGVRENFPLIQAAEEERAIARGTELSAQGEFDLRWKNRVAVVSPGYYDRTVVDSLIQNPTGISGIDLYGGYRQGHGDFAVYDGKEVTGDGGEARLGIQLPLLRDQEIDARRAGLAVAKAGVGVADGDADLKRIDAVLKASIAYWKWVGAGKKLEIVSTLLKVAQVRDQGLKERVELGDIAEFEWKDNQRGVLQRENQLQAAERGLQQASYDLSLYVRDADGRSIIPDSKQIPGTIPSVSRSFEMPLESAERYALSNRPEIRRLGHERKQAEIQDQHAQNQLLPKLDLMLEVSQDMGAVDPTRRPTDVMSGVLLEIPLQRRTAQGKSEVARAKMRKLDRELEYLTRRISAETRDAYSALATSRQQLEIIARELEFARDLEEGERTRFQAGESTMFLVNLREQATADAAIRQIDSLILYFSAEAYLHATLGKA